MASLHSAEMLNNSVILFLSATGGRSLFDQFHPVASSPWPLRGQRFSFFEGGIRSTALLWSPLLRDRGYASDKLYHISDWLPTLVSLAGIIVIIKMMIIINIIFIVASIIIAHIDRYLHQLMTLSIIKKRMTIKQSRLLAGGGKADDMKYLDGFNIWDSLSKRDEPSPRSRILHQLNPYQDNMFVTRLGETETNASVV